jgi:NADPH:quinone reductase-like Zn-dependent oxidoreductase
MASKVPHPVIVKLKAWRTVHGLSQSQAVRVLVDAGLPIKIGTLQQWERAAVAVVHSALTACLGLMREKGLKAGKTLFINGGSGNVGSAVLQVAATSGHG